MNEGFGKHLSGSFRRNASLARRFRKSFARDFFFKRRTSTHVSQRFFRTRLATRKWLYTG